MKKMIFFPFFHNNFQTIMSGQNCRRGILKCKIRGHNHESNNIGVFFGCPEDVCDVFQSVRMFDQAKYIQMYKELTSENIINFMTEILNDSHIDYESRPPLYLFVLINILNTNHGQNLLKKSAEFYMVVKKKLFDMNKLPENHPYYVLKKVIKTELEVEIFYERLSHFYDCCKGGKSFFSEFSENVVDSDNIFSEVAQFL